MQLFLDTEFSNLSKNAELISLALVKDSGEWLYAEATDVGLDSLGDWHQQHVVSVLFAERPDIWERLTNISEGTVLRGNAAQLRDAIEAWLPDEPIEIWGDVPAYDWMLFCELFGGALHLPSQVHYQVFDLATLLRIIGHDPDRNRRKWFQILGGNLPVELPSHHALADALIGQYILRHASNSPIR